ncbi:MAG: type II secretion system protein GspC [Myxococcota bacterium]
MLLERRSRRLFPILVLAGVAAVAGLQAQGLGHLVAIRLGDSHSVIPIPPPSAGDETAGVDADSILRRNPFDSTTGSLLGRVIPVSAVPAPAPAVPETSEGDSRCGFGKVTLISASSDASSSFAAIYTPGRERASLHRMGDPIGDHTVAAMNWNTVWLARGEERCRIPLGEAPPEGAKASSRGAAAAPHPDIVALRPHEFEIRRNALDELLANQPGLMRSAQLVPETVDGRLAGLRVKRTRPGSVLDKIGVRTGDRLTELNGFPVGDHQKLLEAFGRLRSASELSVALERRGKPLTLRIYIR